MKGVDVKITCLELTLHSLTDIDSHMETHAHTHTHIVTEGHTLYEVDLIGEKHILILVPEVLEMF